ncbi:MAG: fatty acid desaturase [Alphaproteobacteria bacterium]
MEKIDTLNCPSGVSGGQDSSSLKEISEHCHKYKGAQLSRSLFQLSTTVVLFLVAASLMFYAVMSGQWLLYALLLLPTSGLLVRLFIIQHDCGHGAYFKTRAANDWVGRFISIATVTPYGFWRRTHNLHHAGSGNLERRGYGGIETLTIAEYKALSSRDQLVYRLYRNPFLLLVLGTPFFVMILQRFAIAEPFPFAEISKAASLDGAKESVTGLNIAMVVFYGALMAVVGVFPVLVVAVPLLIVTSWIGGWLFFIQHQFEDTVWDKPEDWNFQHAALQGSSYYDLHPILHWFTGNIGYHHIHHFSSAIPNYRLKECLEANSALQKMNRITFLQSLKCVRLALWDEGRRKLVSFRDAAVA